MAQYAIDTHVLTWYWSGSPRLSQTAKQIVDEAHDGIHEVIVSPLVLAELVMIAEKQRVPIDFSEILNTVTTISGFRLVGLSSQTAASTQNLSPLPDIHDRLIVATALEYNVPLLTADQAITDSGLVSVVW